ncbi:hypothetical protein [Streptomyces sp. NPDC054797]
MAMVSSVTPGELQGFIIEVVNHGNSTATHVKVIDNLGPEMGPVLDADWLAAAGEPQPCTPIPAGQTRLTCTVSDIGPGESVRIALRMGITTRLGEGHSNELFGEKTNTAHAVFDQGEASGSAGFTVNEGPKLSDSDLQDELNAINKCGRNLQPFDITAGALGTFAETMDDQRQQGVSTKDAALIGYREALFKVGTEAATSLVKIRANVSVADVTHVLSVTGDCSTFVKEALGMRP